MERKRQNGFSLVELAIVLVVAGLILAFGAPALHKYLDSYRVGDAARQVASDMRLARQKAVTNGTRNWYWAGLTGQTPNETAYMTGVSTQTGTSTWSPVVWSTWSLPSNTKIISPAFAGVNYFYYGPDGRPWTPTTNPPTLVSGLVKVASVSGAVADTSLINLDLSGEVWQ